MSSPENMSSPDSAAPTPSAEEFLAPIEPRKSRRTLISVIAAVTVLAMLGVAIASIMVWSGDSEDSQPTGNPEITAAAVRYIDAVNRGVAADYLDSLCQPLRDRQGAITDNPPASTQMNVRAVENVVIDGDVATAHIVIAPVGQPDVSPRSDALKFVNEGGWKFCGIAG